MKEQYGLGLIPNDLIDEMIKLGVSLGRCVWVEYLGACVYRHRTCLESNYNEHHWQCLKLYLLFRDYDFGNEEKIYFACRHFNFQHFL